MSNERTASAWKLVPVEPTDEMIVASTDYCKEHNVWLGDGRFMRMYAVMLSASPEPPALNWRPDREAVARIIDPFNWARFDRKHMPEKYEPAIEQSLAKADRILALPSQPQTEGEDHD